MNRYFALTLGAALLAASAFADDAALPALGKPERLRDGKEFIDVDVGHATPYVIDWDGDGKKDLLVGQFDEGRLRIYLNKGVDAQPEFKGFDYLKVQGKDASVPVS